MISDERGRLDIVRRVLGAHTAPALPAGISIEASVEAADDAAVYGLGALGELVVTADYVRGMQFTLFELGQLTYYDLGYYVAGANLSDVAAMGAQPLGLLSIVRYTDAMTDRQFEDVLTGIADACATHGTTCVGGDIGGAEQMVLAATGIGLAPSRAALRRSGGRPGDVLCVSGPVGAAGAAIVYFTRCSAEALPPPQVDALLRPWRRPRARFDISVPLAAAGVATSCQDISDGLRATIEQTCEASRCGAEIELAAIPVPDEVAAVADLVSVDPRALALSVSVDFELLLAIPRERFDLAQRVLKSDGLSLHEIGVLTDDTAVVAIDEGRRVGLPGVAWRHQPGDVAATVIDGLRS